MYCGCCYENCIYSAGSVSIINWLASYTSESHNTELTWWSHTYDITYMWVFKHMRPLQNQQELCAQILDALKYQYQIDYIHIYRWVRVVKYNTVRMHMETQIEKALQKKRSEKKTSTSAWQISRSLHYGSRLSRWLVHLLPSTKTFKKVCTFFQCT